MTEKGVGYESVHYLEKPFSTRDLKSLLRRAGMKPHEVVRKNEPGYREHVLGRGLTDAQLIDLMVKYPDLIQRPIVVHGEKVVLARPVSRLRELID